MADIDYLKKFMTTLSDNKLEETKISLSRLQALRTALSSFILQFKDDPVFSKVRKICADLSLRLMKVQESSRDNTLQKRIQDEYYSISTLNTLVDVILSLCSQMISEQRKEEEILIKDPTGTVIGRLLAKHFTDWLRYAIQNAPPGENLFAYFVKKGGFSSSLYETIHIPEKHTQKKIYEANVAEVAKLFPSIATDTLEDMFSKYLFSNVAVALHGTCFQYSKSMSEAQNFNMLWIREIDAINGKTTRDFKDIAHEERIYLNIKPGKALDTIRFVASTVSEFLKNNTLLLSFIYFKFKIRVLLTEYDRADTCICYLKIDKGAALYAQQVTKAIVQRLSQIPDDHLNKISSAILKQIKPGLTTATDHDVHIDQGQSYTSQVSNSFWKSLLPHANKQPKNVEELQSIAQQIIIATVEDLQKRNYIIQ